MAPTPALAWGTTAPTQNTRDATATPHSFLSGSIATIEKVLHSSPAGRGGAAGDGAIESVASTIRVPNSGAGRMGGPRARGVGGAPGGPGAGGGAATGGALSGRWPPRLARDVDHVVGV